MGIISGIVALAKTFPIVDGWLTQLEEALAQARVAMWKKGNRDAVTKILTDHDQRDAEAALGSSTAGKLSHDSGAVVTDGPPPNILPKP